MKATILLVQTTQAPSTRCYFHFDIEERALDAIIAMYEERLKLVSPGAQSLTYDVKEGLFRWLDSLFDVSALV